MAKKCVANVIKYRFKKKNNYSFLLVFSIFKRLFTFPLKHSFQALIDDKLPLVAPPCVNTHNSFDTCGRLTAGLNVEHMSLPGAMHKQKHRLI